MTSRWGMGGMCVLGTLDADGRDEPHTVRNRAAAADADTDGAGLWDGCETGFQRQTWVRQMGGDLDCVFVGDGDRLMWIFVNLPPVGCTAQCGVEMYRSLVPATWFCAFGVLRCTRLRTCPCHVVNC
ncbi:hypothetical protein HBI25_175280 [Parastagonospora nodorum]|nr:hypothetical protein HBH50_058390 [Parastagonospora nodorum]KAH4088995.1 hypothetical protein HBH48_121520 [Parastagonospora nodorum]KAH4854533.1 hypothetical protein HBH75_098280 [Parastagonospora nodorum]KAH4936129.1 hypothetical protein HBI79_076950 [Parastagonospora nodorum]KAH4938259.1 hypothetical protein HBH73_165360 [Parastagonospora nodorum]